MSSPYKPRVPRQFVGGYRPRIDAVEKAHGRAPYADDEISERQYPGLLHARVLRCPYPRARIKQLDTTGIQRSRGSSRPTRAGPTRWTRSATTT
jgi:CO/xanthine dehydrogenase Mo-binding subunit